MVLMGAPARSSCCMHSTSTLCAARLSGRKPPAFGLSGSALWRSSSVISCSRCFLDALPVLQMVSSWVSWSTAVQRAVHPSFAGRFTAARCLSSSVVTPMLPLLEDTHNGVCPPERGAAAGSNRVDGCSRLDQQSEARQVAHPGSVVERRHGAGVALWASAGDLAFGICPVCQEVAHHLQSRLLGQMIALECKEEWSAQVSIPLIHRVWVGLGLQQQQQAALAARLNRGAEDPTAPQ
eukprot:scaffold2878_cov73-Phaeocystis_antarctica.AAC.4